MNVTKMNVTKMKGELAKAVSAESIEESKKALAREKVVKQKMKGLAKEKHTLKKSAEKHVKNVIRGLRKTRQMLDSKIKGLMLKSNQLSKNAGGQANKTQVMKLTQKQKQT